ncbi:MAG: hypothetical protein WBD31_14980 [Rubripirellula sp.]
MISLFLLGFVLVMILNLFHITQGPGIYDRFKDDNAYGKTANEIQVVRAELSLIRSLLFVFVTAKLLAWIYENEYAEG